MVVGAGALVRFPLGRGEAMRCASVQLNGLTRTKFVSSFPRAEVERTSLRDKRTPIAGKEGTVVSSLSPCVALLFKTAM